MLVTIEIDADINSISSKLPLYDDEIYCSVEDIFLLYNVLSTKVGSEPVPFSKMLMMVLKLDDT